MAIIDVQPESTRATPRLISDTACDIQALARRIIYLATAVCDAADDVPTQDDKSRNSLDRMLVFNDLINEAASSIKLQAEGVELASYDVEAKS